MKIKLILIAGFILLLAASMASCQPAPAPTAAPVETTPCPDAEPCPECPACPAPAEPVVNEVPNQDLWAASAHNDAEAEAFNHWNEESPAEVPVACANCHSTQGYQEFVSTGAVANPVPAPAGTIQCVACHNEAAAVLNTVTFPSGLTVTGTGPTSRCMTCHQGRASKKSVDDALANFGVTEDPDSVPAAKEDKTLGFINIHYFAAGATLYGTQAKGGYEYDGKSYDGKFRHVTGIDNCIGCHDSHSLEVKLETCQECHTDTNAVEDLKNIRMEGSLSDYDGDGDIQEGIASELAGMQEVLFKGIQEYATNVAGTPIAYNAAAYPYFFIDTNADGQASEDESQAANGYKSWTGRLLKAAYNYQTVSKDPGAFAHNAKYMVQLMYDSTEDLNAKLGTIDMTAMKREDPGHFAGNTEPFRHWDEEGGMVPGGCVKCHQAEGVPQFLANNTNISMPASNGFMCTTCHNPEEWPANRVVADVTFPSGAKVTFGGLDADGKPVADESNLCLLCHQGRSSTGTVDKALAGKDADTPDPAIRFTNIHYFAAGATVFGNEVQGAYQYEGNDYVGMSKHPVNKCQDCHDVHALEVKVDACTACHSTASDPKDPATFRIDATDYDGDGDVTEGMKAEIDAFAEVLYTAIQAYAKDKGTPIVYDPLTYPYFLVDADEDGVGDVGENGPVGYNAFTPNLLKGAYNYQYYQKDPGAFTHNPKYVLQFLFDSIESLGGDVTGLTRPTTPAE